jgi:predicted RNA-binding protein
VIAGVEHPQPSDLTILSRYGLATYFQTAIRLSHITPIDPAVALKPLIIRLAFITNKGKHWGTSLRTNPLGISKADFDLIMAAAAVLGNTGQKAAVT